MQKNRFYREFLKKYLNEIKEQIGHGPNKDSYFSLFNAVTENRFPQWNLSNVENHDVYDAINTLHMICESCGNDTVKEAYEYLVGFVCGQLASSRLLETGAQVMAEHITKFIMKAFNMDVDKESLDYIIQTHYPSIIVNNPAVKISNELLNFNRRIRNGQAHLSNGNVFQDSKTRENISKLFLFNFITVVYILRKEIGRAHV